MNAFDNAADALESAMVSHLEGLSEADLVLLQEYAADLRGFAAEVESENFGITVAEEDARKAQ